MCIRSVQEGTVQEHCADRHTLERNQYVSDALGSDANRQL